ncbi:MAG: Hpt domain-containing protein [Cellvibrionaceae bacterium]
MTDAVIDQEHLSMLKEVMDDEFSVLLETFLIDGVERLGVLEATLGEGDSDAFFKAAHSLKGSSGNIGAMGLSDLCKTAELKGREGDLSGMGQQLVKIKQEYDRVKEALNTLL